VKIRVEFGEYMIENRVEKGSQSEIAAELGFCCHRAFLTLSVWQV